MSRKKPSQAGNALIIVLVMIALLAALTFSMTRSSSKTSGNLNSEQARLLAESIMRTAQGYQGAVQKLVNANRCSENELNFDNAFTTLSYTNADAPTDHRCDFFNAAGSGLKYDAPNPDFLDTAESAKSEYGEWVFYAAQCVLEIGSGDTTCDDTETDLMIVLPHIKKEVCVEINNLNGITNPSGNPPQENFEHDNAGFTGSFAASTTDPEIGEGVSGTNLIRHATGCYQDNAGSWLDSYIFYHVILVR